MPFHTTPDGARLYYRLQGAKDSRKPTLLFVHGWCSNLEHWRYQVKHFSRSHRILRVDRRGMGRSSTPGTGHTARQHATDLAAVAKAAGVRRVVAITSPHHTRRARRVLRRQFADTPIEIAVQPCPAQIDPNWWLHEATLLRIVNEYIKLAYYAVVY